MGVTVSCRGEKEQNDVFLLSFYKKTVRNACIYQLIYLLLHPREKVSVVQTLMRAYQHLSDCFGTYLRIAL